MLSEQEIQEIEAESHRYPDRRALCIDALMIVQRHRGWVSDQALAEVAQFLQLAPAELEGVATFYNMIFRKPVGRQVILLCDSVSCWIMGSERLREHLALRLGIGMGETSADGRFTLLPNVCLGACDHAPVMMIGDMHYQDLDPPAIDTILAGLSNDRPPAQDEAPQPTESADGSNRNTAHRQHQAGAGTAGSAPV